jgi:hypothetical protein
VKPFQATLFGVVFVAWFGGKTSFQSIFSRKYSSSRSPHTCRWILRIPLLRLSSIHQRTSFPGHRSTRDPSTTTLYLFSGFFLVTEHLHREIVSDRFPVFRAFSHVHRKRNLTLVGNRSFQKNLAAPYENGDVGRIKIVR